MATNLSIPTATLGAVTAPVAAQIRYNTTIGLMEMFNGTHWLPISSVYGNPRTWRDWWKQFTDRGMVDQIVGDDVMQKHIYRMMQERFPGNYQVVADPISKEWHMVFDTAEDETWFNLQHI